MRRDMNDKLDINFYSLCLLIAGNAWNKLPATTIECTQSGAYEDIIKIDQV